MTGFVLITAGFSLMMTLPGLNLTGLVINVTKYDMVCPTYDCICLKYETAGLSHTPTLPLLQYNGKEHQ